MGRKKKQSSGQPRDRRRLGLSPFKEERLKEKLRTSTPSEPWVEAQIVSVIDIDPLGQRIHYRLHDTQLFPPGGEATAMVRCNQCNIFNPPHAMEQGSCLDHAEDGGWGPSPSAEAIRAMQLYYLKEERTELPPEDSAALKREIAAYRRRQGTAK